MFLHQRTVPGLASFSYIIGDESSRQCAVIDPVRDVDEYISLAQKHGLTITHILETHVHADFLSGARELKARLNDTPTIHCSGMGGKEWTPSYADHIVNERDEIVMGSLRLQARHTPGHTPEHIIWLAYDDTRSADQPCIIFSGDLLFVGEVGRPDLLGTEKIKSLAHNLYDSIFTVLSTLPDFAEVFPAHGAGSLCGKAIGTNPSSTLGYEKRYNPSLSIVAEQEWIARLMDNMPPAPPYFLRMKKTNVEGPAILGKNHKKINALTPSEVNDLINEGALILDVRSKEAFSSAHIPNSINIPYAPTLANWAGWVLQENKPLILVAEEANHLEDIVVQLSRIGFDKIAGILENDDDEGGISTWEATGLATAHIDALSVQELAYLVQEHKAPYIIDVRTPNEWRNGHIDGAHHLPLTDSAVALNDIPRNTPIAVTCASGYRASIAASLLKRQGFLSVANLVGGMNAWLHEGFPTTK